MIHNKSVFKLVNMNKTKWIERNLNSQEVLLKLKYFQFLDKMNSIWSLIFIYLRFVEVASGCVSSFNRRTYILIYNLC